MTDTCGADRPGRPPATERGGLRPRSERARRVADVVRQQITTGGFPGGVGTHGAGAVYIERRRLLDGLPLSLDSSYLDAEIGRAVLAGDLVNRDVFSLIEEATGHLLGPAEVAVHAVTADPDSAALLQVPAGAALFALDRLACLGDGRPVDAESIRIRADRMTLRATLNRGGAPQVADR